MAKVFDAKGPHLRKVRAGDPVFYEGDWVYARQACEDKHNGCWYCVTHRRLFNNNLQKDGHIGHDNGLTHTMAWVCHEHGVEVP